MKNIIEIAKTLSISAQEKADLIAFLKQAEEKEETSQPEAKMRDFLAWLKASALLSQTIHWAVQGDTFYGDHLLMDRIYQKAGEEIDAYAEKIIPLISQKIEPLDLVKKTQEIAAAHFHSVAETEKALTEFLSFEEKLVAATQEFYQELKEKDLLTLGLDDLLMKISSSHEENIYLLQQRMKQ